MACCKDVTHILERIKHRESVGAQRPSERHRRGDVYAQARQIARAQAGAASAAPPLPARPSVSLQSDGGSRRRLRLWWFTERSDDTLGEGGCFERGEERVTGRGQRKTPRCASERLQRAEDI